MLTRGIWEEEECDIQRPRKIKGQKHGIGLGLLRDVAARFVFLRHAVASGFYRREAQCRKIYLI